MAEDIQTRAPDASAPADLSLADLRAVVASVSDQLLAELVRSEPWLRDPAEHWRLDATLRTGLTAPGLQPGDPGRLLEALRRIQRAESAPGATVGVTPTSAHSATEAVPN